MQRLTPLLFAVAAGCHAYEPAPVDLRAHAREFAARSASATPEVDATDGLELREGRLLAVLLHPDCRLARRRAGVAEVVRDESGRWPDPVLGGDFTRILETVPHPWIAAGSLSITVPLSGRLGREQDLAAALLDSRVADAQVAEARAVDQLDAAWARWSAEIAQVEVLRELIGRLRELEAIAQRLQAADQLTRLGLRTFTLERMRREGELALAEAETEAALLLVKRRLGLHPDAAVRLEPIRAIPLHVADPSQRRERLFDSPRIVALRRAHDVAEHDLALAVANQWPDLVIGPGFEEDDAQPRVTLGFSLPLPLFSGNVLEIRRAEAERSYAAEALRCGYEEVVQELAAAELRLTAAEQQRLLADERLVPLALEQVADGERLAQLGQLDPLLLLDTLVRAHEARTLAIRARLAHADAAAAVNTLFWHEPPSADVADEEASR
jgi:outer membrane protein TolC